MTRDWKGHWDQHVQGERGADPLVQVQRTVGGKPITQAQLETTSAHILHQLDLNGTESVLDLCCGNGLLTAAIEPNCRTVIGVDFCEQLVAAVPEHTTSAFAICADAREVAFPPQSFDRILLAAALQHFELSEVVQLFQKLFAALKPHGVLLVTDIPDHDRIWEFFDSKERRQAHFNAVAAGEPLLGTWFDIDWLEALGAHVGFAKSQSIVLPEEHSFAHYRFDLRCTK